MMGSDWKESSLKRKDFRHTANGPEVPKTRSKKNTRKWCKGVVGREHDLVIELRRSGPRSDCGFWWRHFWHCNHQERCKQCGKITRWTLDKKCPEWEGCIERDELKAENERLRRLLLGRHIQMRCIGCGETWGVYDEARHLPDCHWYSE